MILLTLLLVLSIACVHANEAGFPWTMSGGPSTGLKDITFPINMAQAPRSPGYHLGASFHFNGINSTKAVAAYTGLSPALDLWPERTSTIQGYFNLYGEVPATTTDPNCKRDLSPTLPTLRCIVEFQSFYNHTYNMEVRNVGGTTWAGTILDTVTGVRTTIGSWTLSSGTGGIVSHSNQTAHLVYGPWRDGKQRQCANLPWTRVFFGTPKTTDESVSISLSNKPSNAFTCTLKGQVNLKYEQFGNGILADVGFPNGKGDLTFFEPANIGADQVPMSG